MDTDNASKEQVMTAIARVHGFRALVNADGNTVLLANEAAKNALIKKDIVAYAPSSTTAAAHRKTHHVGGFHYTVDQHQLVDIFGGEEAAKTFTDSLPEVELIKTSEAGRRPASRHTGPTLLDRIGEKLRTPSAQR